ncbi:hypothetical protein DITRI_Ditri06bG0163600 [Diplodiscus trichospermus]
MVSLKLSHFCLVVLAIFLLSHQVHCNDEKDLFQGLNCYRTIMNLPPFSKQKLAGCLAEKLADEIVDDDKPCKNPSSSRGNETRLSDHPKAISMCNIDVNTTTDAIVLPVCVPDMVQTLLLTNYTRTHYSKYINDSSFTIIGMGSEDDWMVVILSKNTSTGSLANGAYSWVNTKVGLGHYMVALLLGLVLCLLQ